jgi:hypothetical protein
MNTRTINIDEGEKRISIVMSFDENLKPSIDSYSVVDRSEYMRGLGDVIARATSAIGIKPCGGCKQRQEALNKLIPFNTNEPESKSDGTK